MLRKKLFGQCSSETETDTNKQFKANETDNLLKSSYFSTSPNSLEEFVIAIQLKLNAELLAFNFIKPPVAYAYNPSEYAFQPLELYIRKYCTTTKKVLFVGMNPGPFGMCQTGIPFGDIHYVRNWLQIEGIVHKPSIECPSRPILGYSCTKKEQSGFRFWGLFAELCNSSENFFKNCFVYNYCPLAFMKADGCNVTPPSLQVQDRKSLESACDASYLELIQLLQPEIIVAVGGYAEKRTNQLFKSKNITNQPKVLRLFHPSPRSLNNQNWPEKARKFLTDNNLMDYFTNQP